MNNAIIARVKTRPHPDKTVNRIQLGDVLGYQVVVGLDVPDDTLGIFFPEGLQLSEEYANANDLIRRKNPETGAYEGGFFEQNRRVRCQKFRKEKSEGFWSELRSLEFAGDTSKLKENDQLTEFNGVPLCYKYVTAATTSAGGKNRRSQRGATTMFKKHFDTEQLRFNYDRLEAGQLISISLKIHGTSQRIGYVLDENQLSWWKRWINKVAPIFPTSSWKYLIGSRNVILKGQPGQYHSEEFRIRACEPFVDKLHKGETVFYEVVGYEAVGTPIMGTVSTTHLKDKEITKTYGPQVTYTYGCKNGEFDIYVYRITQTNEDGHTIDLGWNDIKTRCEQLGIKHVPELRPIRVFDGDIDGLKLEITELTADGPDLIDPSHPKEGIVLRVDSAFNMRCYKQKTFQFGVIEGYIKEDQAYIDAEEVA